MLDHLRGRRLTALPSIAANLRGAKCAVAAEMARSRAALGRAAVAAIARVIVATGPLPLVFCRGELVTGVCSPVVSPLNQRQVFVPLADVGVFFIPAPSRRARNDLVILLSEVLLCPIRISRAVEHEGIHRSWDLALSGSFQHALFNRSIDMFFHVLERNVSQVPGQYTQRFRHAE